MCSVLASPTFSRDAPYPSTRCLKPLPSAKVSIHAPVDAKLPEETFLVVGTKRMRVGAGVHELHDLPAKLLRVTLRVGEWEWDEMLDLTKGEDGTVVFDLEPLTIHGTVFHGKEAAPAKIVPRTAT